MTTESGAVNNAAPATVANANEESAKVGDDCTLDGILVRIGQFGRFQLFNYVLLCIPMIFNAFFSISYVFTASTVVHRWVKTISVRYIKNHNNYNNKT